jgi:tetratricopeptide (TPR) repeat protein
MAYQKTKHVEAAQKFLHQGKIAPAISEYLAILKHEPKDQVTLMTVGDLFVRQGETFQALEYFERLAQIYLADGFLTKAIAIYKKITKLAPEEMRPIERLADLYVQQGVMSEARPIYLQMAEMHQRANRTAQAVGLLRKLLDAEPDNIRVHARLAELLAASGQREEAVATLRSAAQHLLQSGDQAGAIQFADRALQIDSKHEPSLVLRARALVGSGKQSEAVEMLDSLPIAETGGEASVLLVDLYLEAGEVTRAAALAEKVFAHDPKRNAVAQHVSEALLVRGEAERALQMLLLIRAAVRESGEHERFSELLGRAAEALPGRIEPREALVELFGHISDSFRLPDALIHLAEAYEAAGQLDRASQTYAQFLEREPENESIRRRQERLQARLGLAGNAPSAPDFAVTPVPSEPAPSDASASVVEPDVSPQSSSEVNLPEHNLDEETQMFVSQAITDVDLYSSYGLTQKALELLDIVLERVPDHTDALERLLDLSLGLHDERRAVELASRLEQIYGNAGDRATADRFADLRRRFERAAASAPPEEAAASPVASALGPMEFRIPVVEAIPEGGTGAKNEVGETGSDSPSEPAVHEVDLSEEWAALASDAGEAETAAPAEGPENSEGEIAKDSGAQPNANAVNESPFEKLLANGGAPSEERSEQPAEAPEENVDSFFQLLSVELDAAPPSPPAASPPAEEWPSEESLLAAPPAEEANQDRNGHANAEPLGPLGDLFEEFRADLGEGQTVEEDDPETHYNLGVAYREMGLMDEAISEFQKVASVRRQGRAFKYALQCYTLLALAFLEKGQPSIAVSWYERALQVPGLDPETVLALRYDLGVSQEQAGDTEAAQKSFSQVYGMNIDYRDVAERLASLGRSR